MRNRLVFISTFLFFSSAVFAEQNLVGSLADQSTKEAVTAEVPNASKNVESVKSLVNAIKKHPDAVAAGKDVLNNLKSTVANTPSAVKNQAKQKATDKVLEILNKPE